MIKVLIISTNAIGDTYLSMSAIPVLKEKMREVQIDFIIEEHSLFLFKNEGSGNIYLVNRDLNKIIRELRKIRKIKYDYVFSFFPGVVNTFFFFGVRSKNRGGFPNIIRRAEWANKNQRGVVFDNRKIKIVNWKKEENYLGRIKIIFNNFNFGLSNLQKYYLEDREISKVYNDTIILHPFSRYTDRSLSLKQIDRIIDYLIQNGETNFIIVGDEKIQKINEMPGKIFEIKIKPPIDELINLVHCKLFISVDSFPLHIADAYNTNFLGIFSTTRPNSVLLNFNKAIVLEAKALSEISAENIISEIDQYLAGNVS